MVYKDIHTEMPFMVLADLIRILLQVSNQPFADTYLLKKI